MITNLDPTKALNIDVPELISTMGIVTLRCPCIKKIIITGQVGLPMKCASCGRIWHVSANLKLEVREVFVDVEKQEHQLVQ